MLKSQHLLLRYYVVRTQYLPFTMCEESDCTYSPRWTLGVLLAETNNDDLVLLYPDHGESMLMLSYYVYTPCTIWVDCEEGDLVPHYCSTLLLQNGDQSLPRYGTTTP